MSTEEKLETAIKALQKIYEPEKYHHLEPDYYTQCACFQFVAQEALKQIATESSIDGGAQ